MMWSHRLSLRKLLFYFLLLFIISFILLFILNLCLTGLINVENIMWRKENDFIIITSEEKWTKTFQDFNNETGADRFIVPNIIHFIRFNQTEYSLIDYVVIKAAMRNPRPDFFYIHTNVAIPHFTGRYWELIKKDYEISSRIRFFHLDLPSEIFGQPLNISLYFKFYE